MSFSTATFESGNSLTFGAPMIFQNNAVLFFESASTLDVTNVNVSLLSGAQVINHLDFVPGNDVTFGTKGSNQGEFLNYQSIVVGNVTFTTDKLIMKENA